MPDPTPRTAEERAAAVVIATRAIGNDPRDLVDVIDHEQTTANIAAALREYARAMRERCAAIAAAEYEAEGRKCLDADGRGACEAIEANIRALEVP